jgi:hypothetical protein
LTSTLHLGFTWGRSTKFCFNPIRICKTQDEKRWRITYSTLNTQLRIWSYRGGFLSLNLRFPGSSTINYIRLTYSLFLIAHQVIRHLPHTTPFRLTMSIVFALTSIYYNIHLSTSAKILHIQRLFSISFSRALSNSSIHYSIHSSTSTIDSTSIIYLPLLLRNSSHSFHQLTGTTRSSRYVSDFFTEATLNYLSLYYHPYLYCPAPVLQSSLHCVNATTSHFYIFNSETCHKAIAYHPYIPSISQLTKSWTALTQQSCQCLVQEICT